MVFGDDDLRPFKPFLCAGFKLSCPTSRSDKPIISSLFPANKSQLSTCFHSVGVADKCNLYFCDSGFGWIFSWSSSGKSASPSLSILRCHFGEKDFAKEWMSNLVREGLHHSLILGNMPTDACNGLSLVLLQWVMKCWLFSLLRPVVWMKKCGRGRS